MECRECARNAGSGLTAWNQRTCLRLLQTLELYLSGDIWPGLLEAWLALTSVKYHGNLYVLIPLNQRLALTSLWATGPCIINHLTKAKCKILFFCLPLHTINSLHILKTGLTWLHRPCRKVRKFVIIRDSSRSCSSFFVSSHVHYEWSWPLDHEF